MKGIAKRKVLAMWTGDFPDDQEVIYFVAQTEHQINLFAENETIYFRTRFAVEGSFI